MKPGDHPEFFRFPAPAGRSRESSIRLDATGRFWHAGDRVGHAGMCRAFAQWIDRHPDDGRFNLSNGYDWTYLTVEDTPMFVQAVGQRAGQLMLILSDGTSEELGAPVWSGPDEALRTLVRGGRLEAKFTPSAQAGLGDALIKTPAGYALRQQDGDVPIESR